MYRCCRGVGWRLLAIICAALAKKDSKGPLCHSEFRSLERCLASDYERLRVDCAKANDKVKDCLRRDWTYIDDAGGYKRSAEAFNRMKQCRHGVMLYNPLDWYIGRGLEVYGEWGEKKVQLWEKIVKSGHVAIDVGAHIGTLTLPLSKMVGPTGRVVAFEPFYPSYGTLAANVGLNSLQNVEVRQAVVADRVGKVFMNRQALAFNMHDFFNFGSMNFNTLRIYNNSDDVERPSTDWDEYQVMSLDLLSLSRLDFLKIDAEALELLVLQGATRIIKRFKPVIYFEYRNPWEKDTTVLDYLRKKMRYECVLLRVPIFNDDNFRRHAEDIWTGGNGAKIVSFNLLCKHRWWEYPDVNEELLDLFETAVDTDIEGLRTTPTADPFESMAASQAALAKERSELADLGKGLHAAAAQSSGKANSGAAAHRHTDELTLEELLGESDEALGERSEEVSLDELLGTPAPTPQQTNAKVSKIQASPPSPTTRKPYEEMTLDELLDESFTEDSPGDASRRDAEKANPVDEDQLLADLLGMPEAVEPERKKKQPAIGKHAPPKQSKTKRRVEELTLDELLEGIGEPEEEQELTLDDLLGTPNDGAKRIEDMTLDELLGPDPAGDADDSRRYEDMSLDELLALDDPLGPPPSPPQPPKKDANAQSKKKNSSQKKGGASAEKMASKTAGTTSTKKAASSKGAAKPHVKITYDDEINLDEL